MQTRVSLASLLAAGLLVAVSSPAHAAKYKINWLLGHENLDFFEEAAENFKKAVEKGSKGDIQIKISVKSRDEVFPAPEIAAKVSRGEAEMGHSFADVVGPLDNRLWAFEAPYLVRDYQHMEGVIEGPVGRGMLADLGKHGITGLSFTYSGGASGVASVNRELRRPEDLKGLKVGVYGNAADEAWLKSLGAIPVAIGHRLERIRSMAQSGELDAVVITWRNFEQAELHHDFKYFNLPGSTYLVSMTYVNNEFFAKLPARYQELIKTALLESSRIERAKTIELNEIAKRGMLAKGVRPVHLTEEGQRRFVAALKPAYAGPLGKILGAEFVKRIKETGDGPFPAIPPQELARH